MKILLVTQYYFPEPVEKVHDLARGLARSGHAVEVLTGFPCYPRGVVYPGYRQRLWLQEVLDGVPVTRVIQFPDHSKSALRRALYYVFFMGSAAAVGLFRWMRADVVLVYQAALPVGIAGWFLSRLNRAPLVLDVVDLWPESVTSSGLLRSRSAEKMIRAVAKWLYARAVKVNVVTEGFRSNLRAIGVPEEKLSVIHNWMPSETYRSAARDEETGIRENLRGRFNVMYAGNMGTPQSLDTVLDAAHLLRDLPDVQVVFVGGGTEDAYLRGRVADEALTNVRFLGRREPHEMPDLYAWADVLLVHLKPDALTELSIPSKTFAYMAVGKPILSAVRGDGATLVDEERIGVSVAPCDAEALAGAVRSLKERPREELDEIGRRAASVYRDKYCGDVQIARFAQLLTAAAAKKR